MISHAHRAIFVHIQKTGGTSICDAFGQSHHVPEKHFTAVELRDLYGPEYWNSYFKFAFVRNPWDRLVSWWSMIDARRSAWAAGSKVNNFFAYVLTNAQDFEEFLTNCGDEIPDGDGKKCIYRNQIDYLVDPLGRPMVDRICRFERFDIECQSIASQISGPLPEMPKINTSRHDDYTTYYSRRSAALVAERYAKDITAFGYRFRNGLAA